jgi:acylphosphatase
MKAKKLIVQGRVQGVYFRASAKQQAMLLGVKGLIENKPDGSVYLEIEGEDEAVDRMVNWCKSGPALARVKDVKIDDSAIADLSGFRIRS